MSMRTPHSRVSGLGSAGSGTGHFVQQRLTAVANLVLVVFLVWVVLSHLGAGRAELQAAFGNPVFAAAALLAVVSIAWHMRLGMQVVIEDYAESEAGKFVLVALNHFFAVAVAAVSIVSVLMLALGG